VKEQKAAILKSFKIMKRQRHPLHKQTREWFRAEQANFTAKKILTSMGEGLAGINMGQLEDGGPFKMVTRVTGTFAFCGLIDIKGVARKGERGKKFLERIPGEPSPVFYTMKLLNDKLVPYRQVKRLDLGKNIYAYRFSDPTPGLNLSDTITALWYEDGKGQLPGEPVPEVMASLPMKGAQATIIPMITERGQRVYRAGRRPVINGRIDMMLTESPVLISSDSSENKDVSG